MDRSEGQLVVRPKRTSAQARQPLLPGGAAAVAARHPRHPSRRQRVGPQQSLGRPRDGPDPRAGRTGPRRGSRSRSPRHLGRAPPVVGRVGGDETSNLPVVLCGAALVVAVDLVRTPAPEPADARRRRSGRRPHAGDLPGPGRQHGRQPRPAVRVRPARPLLRPAVARPDRAAGRGDVAASGARDASPGSSGDRRDAAVDLASDRDATAADRGRARKPAHPPRPRHVVGHRAPRGWIRCHVVAFAPGLQPALLLDRDDGLGHHADVWPTPYGSCPADRRGWPLALPLAGVGLLGVLATVAGSGHRVSLRAPTSTVILGRLRPYGIVLLGVALTVVLVLLLGKYPSGGRRPC